MSQSLNRFAAMNLFAVGPLDLQLARDDPSINLY